MTSGDHQPGTAADVAPAELESQLDKAQDAVCELQKQLTALRLFQQHDVTVTSTGSQLDGQRPDTDMYNEVREAAVHVVDHMLALVFTLGKGQ